MLMVLFIVPLLLYSILLVPAVQTSVVNYFTTELSKELKAEISIGRVSFRPFKRLVLDDVILYDQSNDTIVAIEKMSAQVDSIFFKRKEIYLDAIKLSQPKVFISKNDSTFNYGFIVEALAQQENNDSISLWNASLETFEITGGRLVYNETPIKETVVIDDLNILVEDIQQDSL